MMNIKRILIKTLKLAGFFLLTNLFPSVAQASFIETTQGTAVVNDASASYFNPAALVLLKNPQLIPQGTIANFHTQFTGQTTAVSTGFTQSGSSSTDTHYYSPTFYAGMPITNKIIIGLAIVSNSANRDVEQNSILRYVQSNNTVQDYDIVPALAIKLNEMVSIGTGINFSYANFDLKPIIGFPGSNIADSQSNNQSDGWGIGGNAGFLIKLNPTSLIGFNYRSLTTYNLSGSSRYQGSIVVNSNNYHYRLWTPARAVLSISHFVTPKLGFITTLQRIFWSSLTNVHIYDIATAVGTTPVIVNGTVPYYLRNTWLLTLGSQYRFTPQWIARVAATYNQSPGNPHYQIANGDSIILGASMGYEINKTVTIDGSYAHAFVKDEGIDITGNRFLVNGVNEGYRDSVSLKLTLNIV